MTLASPVKALLALRVLESSTKAKAPLRRNDPPAAMVVSWPLVNLIALEPDSETAPVTAPVVPKPAAPETLTRACLLAEPTTEKAPKFRSAATFRPSAAARVELPTVTLPPGSLNSVPTVTAAPPWPAAPSSWKAPLLKTFEVIVLPVAPAKSAVAEAPTVNERMVPIDEAIVGAPALTAASSFVPGAAPLLQFAAALQAPVEPFQTSPVPEMVKLEPLLDSAKDCVL